MTLIRNTLFVIAFIQLLFFAYIKLIHEKSFTLRQEIIVKVPLPNNKHYTPKKLPISTEYTDTLQPKFAIKQETQTVPQPPPLKEDNKVKLAIQKKISKPNITIKKKSKPIQKTYKANKQQKPLYAKIESYAKKFLGNKYVWGATGPKCFDCSGFTQKVYAQTTGIHLPRVSREQAKVGKYVQYSRLKKGDMVFFDTAKKKTGKVNHVGIYIGKNNFIHASSGGKKVMITNFNKKRFYKNRFLYGRRVLKENSHQNLATLVEKDVSKI